MEILGTFEERRENVLTNQQLTSNWTNETKTGRSVVEKLLALLRHASQLNTATGIDAVVKHTLDALEFALGFDYAGFLLVENKCLQVKGIRGMPLTFSALPLDGRGLTVKAANTKRTVRVSDTQKEPDYVDLDYDWKGPPTLLSELDVPVLIDGEAVAVLAVNRVRPNAFTDEDQILLEMLAAHVASCLTRLKDEEAKRESEERYRSLFDRTLDGIYLSTHGGRFVDVNPAFVKMFGYSSKQEMLDIGDIKKELYFSPDERGSHLLDTGKEEVEVYRMRRRDGSEIWVEDHGRYIHDEQGNVIYHEGMLRDVTEHKRAEEALRESEEKYRTIFHESPLGIFRSTFEGRLLEVNPALAKVFGYDSPESMTHEVHDVAKQMYVRAEDRQRIIANQFGSNDITQHLNHYRRKDGSEFIANLYLKTVRDPEGRPIFLEGIVEDITERKQAEAKLLTLHNHAQRLASARKVDEMIEHTLDAMEFTFGFSSAEFWLVDETRGRILRDGARGIAGRISEFRLDGPGVTVKAVNTGRTIKVADSRNEEAYVDDEGRAGKEKSPVKLSELAVPVLIDSKVVALLGAESISLDYFTDEDQRLLETLASHVALAMLRLRHEDELRRYSEHLEELVKERSGKLAESEARYRRLFESSPISLWEEDFSQVKRYFDDLRSRGVKDLRRHLTEHLEELAKCASMVKILDVNEATLRMYGAKSVEELRGELRRVFTDEFQDNFREELVALGEGQTRFASEFDNQTLIGDIKHVSLIMSVIPGYEDTLAKILVSIIDLTERKKMEQRLQQAERLAAVGETAAMVGHDLRNPLQGIAGAVHLLKQESLTAKDRDEMLQVIEKSLDHSDAIIRDLSDYSAEIQLKLAEATPKSITRDAIGAVKVPQNLTVQDSSENQPALRVDLDRMRRVFFNLIQNAIDAMPQGGTLTISSKQSDGGVEITLSDTGLGMPEKIMQNIWKPLQTTKAKGLGLGLAICKRIVEAHRGTISVKSKAGEGTTVTICLPIKPAALEVTQK